MDRMIGILRLAKVVKSDLDIHLWFPCFATDLELESEFWEVLQPLNEEMDGRRCRKRSRHRISR